MLISHLRNVIGQNVSLESVTRPASPSKPSQSIRLLHAIERAAYESERRCRELLASEQFLNKLYIDIENALRTTGPHNVLSYEAFLNGQQNQCNGGECENLPDVSVRQSCGQFPRLEISPRRKKTVWGLAAETVTAASNSPSSRGKRKRDCVDLDCNDDRLVEKWADELKANAQAQKRDQAHLESLADTLGKFDELLTIRDDDTSHVFAERQMLQRRAQSLRCFAKSIEPVVKSWYSDFVREIWSNRIVTRHLGDGATGTCVLCQEAGADTRTGPCGCKEPSMHFDCALDYFWARAREEKTIACPLCRSEFSEGDIQQVRSSTRLIIPARKLASAKTPPDA